MSPPPETFTVMLFRCLGPSGWHFTPVPDEHVPPVTHGRGRTPVIATIDGQPWKASVWRDKSNQTLLAVPKRVRGAKDAGDLVVALDWLLP